MLVVLLFAAAAGVALAREGFTERLRSGAPAVKRWGGNVLVAVGLWLVALAVFADAFARLFPV